MYSMNSKVRYSAARRVFSLAALTVSILLILTLICSCGVRPIKANEQPIVTPGEPASAAPAAEPSEAIPSVTESPAATEVHDAPKPAKYVFVFIGDGMSINITAAARCFAESGAAEHDNTGIFTDFEHIGLMTTHNIRGSVTDSAASATAMFSGVKAENGTINLNKDTGESYKTMAQRLSENGYRVGVISTTPINHATPAAIYASAEDRYDYDSIAAQGIENGWIDFWGGGDFRGDRAALTDAAIKAGFELFRGKKEISGIGAGDTPVIAVSPTSEEDPYMPYELDRIYSTDTDNAALSEVLESAVRRFGDDEGFFIMTEAGKIDTALSQKDAGSAIYDILALEDAVSVAVSFMNEHPEETLIVVTADHETGGVLLGSGDRGYIARQGTSYALMSRYMQQFYDAQAESDVALEAIGAFGSLSDVDEEELRDAYRRGRDGEDTGDGLDPFSAYLCGFIGKGAGVNVTTTSHTGGPVAVYADGCGADAFGGYYDNTELFKKLLYTMNINDGVDTIS